MTDLKEGGVYATPDGRPWVAAYNAVYAAWELRTPDESACLELCGDGSLDLIPEFGGVYFDDLREPTAFGVGQLREIGSP